MKTIKLCPHRARAGHSESSARRLAKASFFSLVRSVPLAALVLVNMLSAAPTRQPFRQPLVFEQNHGQAPLQASWAAHGPGYQLQLTSDAVVMVFRDCESGARRTLQMRLTGSRPWSHVAGLDPTGGVSNYLNRPNGAHSLSSIPHYGRVRVSDVYQGIDLVLYSNGGNLEYDFLLQPGADPQPDPSSLRRAERPAPRS